MAAGQVIGTLLGSPVSDELSDSELEIAWRVWVSCERLSKINLFPRNAISPRDG